MKRGHSRGGLVRPWPQRQPRRWGRSAQPGTAAPQGLHFNGTNSYVNLGTPADLYLPRNYTYNLWFKVGKNIYGNSGPQYLMCIGSRSDLIIGIEDNVGSRTATCR